MSFPHIEVGYGMAREDDSLRAGQKAARQARESIRKHPLSAALVFASVRYDLPDLLSGIKSVMGDVPLFGASTAGEICNGTHQKSVAVAALASPYVTVRIGVGRAVSADWQASVHQAVSAPSIFPFFSLRDNSIWNEMTQNGESAFGMVFSPGNTGRADSRGHEILEELKQLSLGRLPMFGGGAADDWLMEANYVFWDNQAYSDSLLVAVFQTSLQFGIAMAHGFRPSARIATVTKAHDHEVLELDGRPADEVYAELLEVSKDSLEGTHLTLTTGKPLGIRDAYGEYIVTVASLFTPGGGLRLSRAVSQGTMLTVMEPSEKEMLNAGKEALLKAMLRSGVADPAVVFTCSCALRSRILGEPAAEEISRMKEMVPGMPVVGFYSFGEYGTTIDGVHRYNNSVITALSLGRDLSYAARVAEENRLLRSELDTSVTERKRIEEALQKRIIALTQPLSDPGVIELSDLFDIEDIQRIQDAFADATGVSSLITRPNGTPITQPSNFCTLCGKIIRKTDKGLANCIKFDAMMGRYNPSGPLVQRCLGSGLWNAGASITIGGKHIANWLIGQVRDEELDENRILEYADEIGADPEEFAKALAEVPVMSRERFEKVSQALFCFANELSTKAFQNVQQARFIADRQKAEALRMRLVTAIEQAVEGVLVTDTDGKIQYVNPALEKMTGYDSGELIGKTPRAFKSGEHDQSFYRKLWETIRGGEVWGGRLVNRRKDGRLYHEDETISPVRDASGKIVNFVALKRDITEHLELSRQLLRSQKMEAVGTLAGGVAHDFNNVLTIIQGFSELLLMQMDEKDPGYSGLRKIHEAGLRGAELVQNLLAFSRKADTNPRPMNLNHEVARIEKLLGRTIPKMIEIDLHLDSGLAAVDADPGQMGQVLMNLAVNAEHAMPDGGNLTIATSNISLDEEYCRFYPELQPGNYVLLTVSDTGHGMDRETLEHIYEPFFTTKHVGKGTGLGLAIVYGIVRQHGGHITCYSEPGHGTTFKIYLPAILQAKTGIGEEPKQELPRGGTETILLVDDEDFIRDLGRTFLSGAGYTVLTAASGPEAVQLYLQEGEQISLIILDLIMPEIGGDKCLEEILAINPDAKILISSGGAVEGKKKEIVESGAKGFVSKPFHLRHMLKTVREVLDEG